MSYHGLWNESSHKKDDWPVNRIKCSLYDANNLTKVQNMNSLISTHGYKDVMLTIMYKIWMYDYPYKVIDEYFLNEVHFGTKQLPSNYTLLLFLYKKLCVNSHICCAILNNYNTILKLEVKIIPFMYTSCDHTQQST